MPTGVEEAAALAGLIGLGFQCLAGCITGFQLLNTALHVGQHTAFFRCALLLEENRLLLWAKRSGISNEDLDKRLNVRLVLEVLGNLQNLLCDVEKLRVRYKFDVKFTDPPSGKLEHAQYDPMSDADLQFLTQNDLRQERDRIATRSKTIQKKTWAHKKFWFAAVDKAKFGELISEISYLNLGLQGILDDVKQAALEADVHMQRLQSVNFANKLNDIQYLIESLAFADAKETPLAQLKGIKLKEGPSRDTEQGKLWTMDLQNLLRQKPTTFHTSLIPIFANRFSKEKHVANNMLHAIRTYDNLPVYVEWKKYGWAARDEEMKNKALNSIANLALLLNAPKVSKFGTLHCMGLVEDGRSQSYQFVYTWPQNCNPDVEPRSLKEYMNSSFMPSLTDRIQLGRDLANSILLFHAPDWLHKNLCSDNILFFPKDSTSPRSLKHPFIVGFEYSRPDIEGQPSERAEKNPEFDIYRHPDYMSNPPPCFHKIFDIYSFGLVLLEIAKWRPLKRVYTDIAWEKYLRDIKEDKNQQNDKNKTKQEKQDSLFARCDKPDLEHMRAELVSTTSSNSISADIAFRAGSVFAEAVSFCLRHKLDLFKESTDLVDGRTLQEAFFENVIKKFDLCVV